METINVGIIGATGCVGLEMLRILEEKQFPIKELRLYASQRSAGRVLPYLDREITVSALDEADFSGLDFVLGAVSNSLAKEVAEKIVASKAIFIDNSSAFRLQADVPLVVPEINPKDAFNNQGIIANPNCSTIISAVAINAINELSAISAINACTYQAVSGAGIAGMQELQAETRAIMDNKPFETSCFNKQIAFNCLPMIGSVNENGFTTEEMKMQNEMRKIMHLPNLKVNCTCVRVPVMRSHSIALTLQLTDKVTIAKIKDAENEAQGVVLVDDVVNNTYPTPLEASDQDLVMVGRIRKDLCNEKGVSLWCVGDQIRKGAASNAIGIMELFLK